MIEQFIVNNEWETKDTLNYLYRFENGIKKNVLKYYSYKDDGGDCNNLFWNTETFRIEGDSLVFETIFYQKTGIDPIPEKRKQIYKVQFDGRLKLVYDKYKLHGKENWTHK